MAAPPYHAQANPIIEEEDLKVRFEKSEVFSADHAEDGNDDDREANTDFPRLH